MYRILYVLNKWDLPLTCFPKTISFTYVIKLFLSEFLFAFSMKTGCSFIRFIDKTSKKQKNAILKHFYIKNKLNTQIWSNFHLLSITVLIFVKVCCRSESCLNNIGKACKYFGEANIYHQCKPLLALMSLSWITNLENSFLSLSFNGTYELIPWYTIVS